MFKSWQLVEFSVLNREKFCVTKWIIFSSCKQITEKAQKTEILRKGTRRGEGCHSYSCFWDGKWAQNSFWSYLSQTNCERGGEEGLTRACLSTCSPSHHLLNCRNHHVSPDGQRWNQTDYIIFFAAEVGEALYSQQKQDLELTVAQIMNSLLQNSDLNWRKWGKPLDHSGMT